MPISNKVKFISGPFDEDGFKWKGRVVTHGVLGIAIKLKPRRGSFGGGTTCVGGGAGRSDPGRGTPVSGGGSRIA